MNDTALSRIPFRVRDELMIGSMARWMRFVGIIKVVSGLVMAFLLLVAIIYVGAVMGADSATAAGPGPGGASSTITVSVDGNARQLSMDQLRRIVSENQVTFFALGTFALILAVAGTMLGFVLYQAADDFDRVARTDVADQDYITAGVMQLNTYFKISILLGVAAVLVALTAGISLVTKIASGS